MVRNNTSHCLCTIKHPHHQQHPTLPEAHHTSTSCHLFDVHRRDVLMGQLSEHTLGSLPRKNSIKSSSTYTMYMYAVLSPTHAGHSEVYRDTRGVQCGPEEAQYIHVQGTLYTAPEKESHKHNSYMYMYPPPNWLYLISFSAIPPPPPPLYPLPSTLPGTRCQLL